jgi:GTP-binding protein LepA
MSDLSKIRNFCIIAHIDHGKSTLADRLLEITHTVSDRDMKAQLLDQMDLERERGITIKLQPVQMKYRYNDQDYVFNLIDTPGHVDFSYEVSRSLVACEGALLVVDSTQGIEAQTLANAYMAMEHNLVLIPVINKIDLPNSDANKVAEEMKSVFGFKDEDFLFASGKTGAGVPEILAAVAERVPPPQGDSTKPLQALIFDSSYDPHRGVVCYVRIVNGELKAKEKIRMMGSGGEGDSLEVGFFKPFMTKSNSIPTGSVGYVVTGLREVAKASVGDTLTLVKHSASEPLPGYKQVRPMVYASIFPVSGDDYPILRDAMEKLKLNDAALTFEPENIPSIGFGFRTGFLGLLHMDIVQERLSREYNLDLVLTAPSVVYEIKKTNDEVLTIYNPAGWPDPSNIKEVREPWAKAVILTPSAYIGSIMEIVTQRRGINQGMDYVGTDRVEMRFEMPLATIITDFYDKLKSVSSGYASLNYEIIDLRPGDLVKLDILVAGEPVEALSAIVHRSTATSEGRSLVSKLKELIPRQQFEIAIQAAIGSKVIARENISALRKDVTTGLYGGDVTRKMKVLNKQKRGKKRMKKIGRVDIPQEAFLAVLKK